MEEYRIILESQLGPREGILRVEGEKDAVTGTLTLLGYENPVFGQWTGERSLRLSHSLHTSVSSFSCISVFETEKNRIFGTLQNGRNTMEWHGEKISSKEEGSESNGGE